MMLLEAEVAHTQFLAWNALQTLKRIITTGYFFIVRHFTRAASTVSPFAAAVIFAPVDGWTVEI